MRKIIIIGAAHPYRGGLATFNEQLAISLQNRNHEVRIETFTLQYPSILFPGKTQFTTESAPKNININRSINTINPFNWISFGLKIKKEKPDLVIFKFWIPFVAPCFGTISRIIKQNKHTKILAINDNVIPHEKRPFDNQLINYFINGCNGFICMSKNVMDDLIKFNIKKPSILTPHPIFNNFGKSVTKEIAIAELNFDKDFMYLLFFGFIRGYKGLDLLLKAMAHDKIKNRKIKLIIAGEFYEDAQNYLNLIDDLGIKDNVILKTEFIPNSEVYKYFCACDIVVQPYKSATQSGVTQIAYHFDKPMIVTNVGGLPEMIPHQKVGFVVNPDPNEIASAIDHFFATDPSFYVKNIQEEKKKYSWDIFSEKIEQLYSSLLKG